MQVIDYILYFYIRSKFVQFADTPLLQKHFLLMENLSIDLSTDFVDKIYYVFKFVAVSFSLD